MAINTLIPTDPLGFPCNEPLVFQTLSPLGQGKNYSPLGSQPTLMLLTDTGSETFTVQL